MAFAGPASPLGACEVREVDDVAVVYACGPLSVVYHHSPRLMPGEAKARLDQLTIPGWDNAAPSSRETFTISVDKRTLPAVRMSGTTSHGEKDRVEMVVDERDAGAVLISCGGEATAASRCTEILSFLARNGASLTAQQEATGRVNRTKRIMQNVTKAIAGWAHDYPGRGPTSMKELVDARYLTKESTDAWGRPFVWRCPGEHYPFIAELISLGADGKKGTSDDLESWRLTR